ncbi:sulfurtransferase TusA family protein [Maritimibacter sp. UBA3975]|uniref:sulfurtransferase TusA family protein n=1 Tax=Maritimibacter sp. UBA3975 TaxID=1946833 RepID=UPI000C09A56E|nr:sulfurtransferase TusA family protein [Maritimibacter sp. UBA3975]MAM60614.1 preprotein translocase subunit TatB [Maritimibacter sp.]|tara:strand:- start:14444 stop:14671 length:228 start_codon:yes stop_codon:yes gene_type:complete
MKFDVEIDATGLMCPWPVLKAGKALRSMADGQILRLLATDPVAVIDVPHFCAEQGHELIDTQEDDGTTAYIIRKR